MNHSITSNTLQLNINTNIDPHMVYCTQATRGSSHPWQQCSRKLRGDWEAEASGSKTYNTQGGSTPGLQGAGQPPQYSKVWLLHFQQLTRTNSC